MSVAIGNVAVKSSTLAALDANGGRFLKYVHRCVTRHGKVIWYYRRGPLGRIRLPNEYGSEEFMARYNAIIDGEIGPDSVKRLPRLRLVTPMSQYRLGPQEELVSKMPSDLVKDGAKRQQFVYFALCGYRLKIGTSKNPRGRIEAMQGANPEPIRLIGVCHGGLHLERYLHTKFENYRIGGEWFAFVGELREMFSRAVKEMVS